MQTTLSSRSSTLPIFIMRRVSRRCRALENFSSRAAPFPPIDSWVCSLGLACMASPCYRRVHAPPATAALPTAHAHTLTLQVLFGVVQCVGDLLQKQAHAGSASKTEVGKWLQCCSLQSVGPSCLCVLA